MATRTPVPPDPAAGWREEVVGASGLNVLAGIWLIIAPFVLNYGRGDSVWNDVICGVIVGVLALAKVGGLHRAVGLSWINAIVGVWLFVSAFWLEATATAGWNNIILGIIVFVLALWSATASETGVFGRGAGGLPPEDELPPDGALPPEETRAEPQDTAAPRRRTRARHSGRTTHPHRV